MECTLLCNIFWRSKPIENKLLYTRQSNFSDFLMIKKTKQKNKNKNKKKQKKTNTKKNYIIIVWQDILTKRNFRKLQNS